MNDAKNVCNRLPADPRLNAEPAARDDRTHQRRQIRAERAVRRARKNRKRNAVFRSRMRIEQDRREHDRVAEQDRDQRLPPVHPGRDQARRHHIRRYAVRHRDPQRGVVVRRPVAFCDRNGREVFVIERRCFDFRKASPSVRRVRLRVGLFRYFPYFFVTQTTFR